MSHHLEDMLLQWRLQPREPWVLAVITRVQGSSYRKSGAIMLFHPLGKSLGLLSGGCLEADLRRHAQRALQTQTVVRVDYDASDESDRSYQLGCGGLVSILLAPLLAQNHYLGLPELCAGLSHRQRGFYRLMLAENGSSALELKGQFLTLAEADFPLSDFQKTGTLVTVDHGACHESLLVPVRPQYHLGIFGGGQDARPLAAMARSLGWRVTVMDGRSAYARPGDFPGTHLLRQPLRDIDDGQLSRLDACVIMHHNLTLDAEALVRVQPFALEYIALLGPGHRRQRVLALAGLTLADFGHRLSAPAGLALGGELPESVALSILAQCHGVLHGAKMLPLAEVMA
jgi:xanthine dehydrogenase accessory factor